MPSTNSPAAAPSSTASGADDAVKPARTHVATVDVDGRELQTVCEWFDSPNDLAVDFDAAVGKWIAVAIYDPFSREFYRASRPSSARN